MGSEIIPGFYGKLPVLGDFVSRRISHDFIAGWDDWLQNAIACSREELGEQWLEYYLTSPIWRFIVSPGVCGSEAYAGILMSSVDRVGRYFPLTIAVAIKNFDNISSLTTATESWFADIEAVALMALEKDLAVDDIDELLSNVDNDCWHHKTVISISANNNETLSGKKAFFIQAQHAEVSQNEIMQGLNHCLLNSSFIGYSLWQNGSTEPVNSSLLLCEGLPPVNAYSGLLSGQMPDRGWNLHKKIINRSAELQQSGQPEIKPDDNLLLEINSSLDTDELDWKSQSAINCGKRRQINEDALLDRADKGLWVVADGMGGHQAGDVASTMIVEAMDRLQPGDSLQHSIELAKECLQQVNGQLRHLAASQYGNDIIGSTVVALIAGGGQLACIWAGDSRLYRLRHMQLQQMTVDHCSDLEQSEGLADLGMESVKFNNVITRAIGAFDDLELDCEYIDFQSGDKFLLCSDGVDKELSPVEIERILNEDNSDDADALMQAVLTKQARDNVSIIVIEASENAS